METFWNCGSVLKMAGKLFAKFVLFAVLLLLVTLPKGSRASTLPIVGSDGKYSLYLLDRNPACEGGLEITSPTQKLITTALDTTSLNPVEVGNFIAGQELRFEVTTNCAPEVLDSSNPNQAAVISNPEQGIFVLVWLNPSNPEGYIFYMLLRKESSGLPAQCPVLFTTGFNGSPTEIYVEALEADPYNYPEDFLSVYDSEAGTFEEELDRVADLYYLGCGEDCLDAVGFSSGSALFLEYLAEHSDDSKIRKAISVGGTHEGVWLLQPDAWLEEMGFPEGSLKESLQEGLTSLRAFLGLTEEVAELPTVSSANLDFESLFGQAPAQYVINLFVFEMTKDLRIGDGLVATTSAAPFVDQSLIKFVGNLSDDDGGYAYSGGLSGTATWLYNHKDFPNQPDVLQQVVSLLTD